MKKIIFLLMSLFSLAVSAADNINGGFVVAPILADGYAAYGDCLSPAAMESDGTSYVAGSFVTIINAQTTTDIKSVNAIDGKSYYVLQGNLLKVYSPASLFSLDGKQICSLKTDAQIDIATLPGVFVIKFKNGTAYKLQKQ